MNAQSNHPISSSTSDTTDPLFLGPEAGQQAEVEAEGEQGGSELDANDFELHRHFSIARGALISVRSNGVTLCRQVDDDWMVLSRKKVDVPLHASPVATRNRRAAQHAGPDDVERGRHLRNTERPPRGARWHRT